MPDAPVQIIANASTSAPTAPVQVAADGSGSTPTAPVQIAANGSGSTPSAPVQIAADGSVSTPSEPAVMVANGELSGVDLRATGTLTDGTNPVVFPVLIRVAEFQGRASWTSDGLPSDATRLAGNYYFCYWVAPTFDVPVGKWYLIADLDTNAIWTSTSDTATPDIATGWTPAGAATGTPVLSIIGGSAPAAPVQVSANGSGSTPAAPVQIAANGSGSTPAAPVQIAANGSGSTPTAPPAIV